MSSRGEPTVRESFLETLHSNPGTNTGGFNSGRYRQSLPPASLMVTATSGMTAAFGFTDTMRPPRTLTVSKSAAMRCLRRLAIAASPAGTGLARNCAANGTVGEGRLFAMVKARMKASAPRPARAAA